MSPLPILFGLFASAVVMTNAVSANIIQVGPLVLVAGALLYPVTFLVTDILSEVYGKRVATVAVWTGFAAQVLAVVFVQVAAMFPSMDEAMRDHWTAVFLPMARIAVASMAAYLVAQLLDVRTFHLVRGLTGGRWLWLRNNISTITSQAFDSVVFVVVGFAGVLPTEVLLSMIGGQYIAKVILAAADTPLCYLGVSLVRRLENRCAAERP